jgi:hypothetical protein
MATNGNTFKSLYLKFCVLKKIRLDANKAHGQFDL